MLTDQRDLKLKFYVYIGYSEFTLFTASTARQQRNSLAENY